MRIAILGGGVSGLALGHYLAADGRTEFAIFEAAPVPGGLCRSKQRDGFTYDLAGGHILFSKDREVWELMRSMCADVGGAVRSERRTAIRWHDQWVKYPFENGIGDLPPQARFECLAGYLRAVEQRKQNGAAPRRFDEWVRWRFGDGIAQHFMDPYNEKIWCYPLREISSGWVAGRVPDAPIEDIIKAACQVSTEGYTHQAVFDYPAHGGFQAITDGFAARCGERLRLSTPVQRVERAGDGFLVNGERFDRVVNTMPLQRLIDVVPALPEDAKQAVRSLRWLGLSSILIALKRAQLEPRSWIYLPFADQGPANRVTYFSNYAPSNAPQGCSSLMAEITFPKEEAPRNDAQIVDELLRGLERAGILRREEVLFTDVTTQPYAYVVFDHDFDRHRDRALAAIEGLGLETFGRFGRFEYLNSDQCVERARNMAQKLLARLGERAGS
ncbi:MAG: FAD-dependent oxidoreductase [Planctomycetes bacterium]|nr:FAD-dependent oxidoreductase [Planctomycetota bacterium]